MGVSKTWRPRADAKILRSYPTSPRLEVLALGFGVTLDELHLRAAQLGLAPRGEVRWLDTLPEELRARLVAGPVRDAHALRACANLSRLKVGGGRLGALVRLAAGEAHTPEGALAAQRACERLVAGDVSIPAPAAPTIEPPQLDGERAATATEPPPEKKATHSRPRAWTEEVRGRVIQRPIEPERVRVYGSSCTRCGAEAHLCACERVVLTVTQRCCACRRVLACGSRVASHNNRYWCSACEHERRLPR